MASPSRVLVIEDDKHFASQLKELLEFNGHAVGLAHSGPEGVDRFSSFRPDFVLMDVMLPNLHGIRVLEKIRGLDGGADVPVILMSAVYRSESIFAKDIKRLGALGFLSKPFSLMDLARKVDKMLARPDRGRDEVRELLAEARATMTGPVPVVPEEEDEDGEPAPAEPVPAPAPTAEPAPASTPTPPPRKPEPIQASSTPSLSELPAAMRQPRKHELDSGDSFVRVDTSRRLPAVGELTPAVFVQMLTTLFHSHSSGRFVLEMPLGRKTIFLLNGYPVWVEWSDPMNGLPRWLRRTGLLTDEQLGKLGSDARDGAEFRQRLLLRGLLRADELDEQLEAWVADELRAAVGHRGPFKFHRGDDFAGSIPVYETNPIRALRTALPEHLDLGDLQQELDALEGRSIGRTRTFNRLFGYVASTQTLRSLGEALLRPRRIEEVRSRFPDRSGDVTRCLWFMIHAGLLALSDSPEIDRPTSSRRTRKPQPRVATPPSQPAPQEHTVEFTTGRVPAEVVSELRNAVPKQSADHQALIVRDYVTRMDLDHYAFLGVPADSTLDTIDRAYQALAPRYRLVNLGPDIQGDVRRKAKELLTRLVQAFDELSDPARRARYDQLRTEARAVGGGGDAGATTSIPSLDAIDTDAAFADEDLASISMVMDPIAEEPQVWWPGADNPAVLSKRMSRLDRTDGAQLAKAHASMAQGDWNDAAQTLEQLRHRHPSNPGILADLGWCRYAMAPTNARALDKAMEWADLALAFDPEYADALEVRARILSNADRPDDLKRALKMLLRFRKDSAWGKAQLARLDADPDEAKKGGSLGRLFGRRR